MRNIPWWVWLIPAGLAAWIGLYPHDWQTWLGFSRADYFVYGTNYAFASGPGPMLETALFASTALFSLWHVHNCHQDGCARLGKHLVNGSKWCNRHHEQARNDTPPQSPLEQKIDTLIESIDGLAEAIRVALLTGRRP